MRDWLKKARTGAKMTMKETAKKIGVSESYYCAIENGTRQRSMDLSLAQKLSDIFQLPVKQILDDELAMLKDTDVRGDDGVFCEN